MSSCNIPIPNLFLTGKFPKYTLLSYLIMAESAKKSLTDVYFTTSLLSYLIDGSTTYQSDEIKNAVNWLSKKDLIKKVKPTIFYINKDMIRFDSFTLISDDEFSIILNSKKRNREALLLHIARLMNSLDYKNFNGIAGHMSAESFNREFKLCEKSFYSYNSTLKELGLIVSEPQGFNSYTGQWYPNLYGRKKDEHEIKRLANVSRKNAATANTDELFG